MSLKVAETNGVKVWYLWVHWFRCAVYSGDDMEMEMEMARRWRWAWLLSRSRAWTPPLSGVHHRGRQDGADLGLGQEESRPEEG